MYGNFSGVDLFGVDFGQVWLYQVMFNESKLVVFNFKVVYCEEVEFYGVDVIGAQFVVVIMGVLCVDGGSQFSYVVFDGV